MTGAAFTLWRRSMDGPELQLFVVGEDGHNVEEITMDVRELPAHPELLARLGPQTRERLLHDAAECQRGNFTLNPEFDDVPVLPPAVEPYRSKPQ